ncbi:MAG: serine/threonine protein kinase, partial [Deltaproteobacteria bacterium]|nr:serine/threonine protein kinase [Deltaproteobacteria bacterium]
MQVPASFTECPEDGLLALFIERALDVPVADRLRDHLDDCDTCRRGVMAWVEHTEPTVNVEAELQLGHFMLRRRLGAGGMGIVYAAFDTRLQREVAIKLLVSAGDPDADRMLLDEARAQARVAHPSVLTVYEVDEVDGVHYIAMELIRGQTLRAHLAAQRCDVSTILRLYAHAARGLAAAHALGVIHRDFKPDNVLVEEDPAGRNAVRVVVADFGLAAFTGTDDPSSPGAGTPGYMAPEQHAGCDVDARADVFSFAVALWESLYKERPYQRGTVRRLVPPSRPDVPAATRAWLVQALALDPEQRPSSIETAVEVLAPQPKRGRAVLIAAASLAVAGVVGAWSWSHVAASAPTETCDATLDDWHTWEFQATASGVPAWARARVTHAMATRARDVANRGAAACASPRPAERQAWTACRAEQTIVEREALAALARPWSTYARIDDALDLPWVSTCTTRAAELALVLRPTAPEDRRALDEARATLARIELAWQAGRPRAEWEAQLAALDAESLPPAVHAAIAVERHILEATLATEVDARKPLPLLETAVADAERSGDLVGAARAWLFLARLRAGRGDPKAPAAFEQAGWAIERIGDPPALRATWHASMTGLAWSRSDLPAALAHAREAAALETSGGAS